MPVDAVSIRPEVATAAGCGILPLHHRFVAPRCGTRSGLSIEADKYVVGAPRVGKGTQELAAGAERRIESAANKAKFSMITLHNTAVATEKALLAGAADRYQQYQAEQGDVGPIVNVLGPEAIMEMGILVGNLVKKLDKVTSQRRAEKALSIAEHDPAPPVDADSNPDDPGLEWEEVDEDE